MVRLVEEKWCPLDLSHTPNDETMASIQDSEQKIGVIRYDSMEKLFEELGLQKSHDSRIKT